MTSLTMTELDLVADTQAILLLCGYFNKRSRRTVKPLALGEYNTLATWLHSHDMRPADLMEPDGRDRLQHFGGDGVHHERLQRLLDRGFELGVAIEEWQRQGIWVISRGDEDYPRKLKIRLRERAPSLLYGVGDAGLLDRTGLGLVGSRDASKQALDLTREVAKRCADEGLTVVSGGARGVDQEAMFGALEAGGSVLAILAEGVAKAAVAKKYRSYIATGQLTLVSTFYPKARWTIGNAMGRNKYIYVFSDWALAVSSGTKGGTWSGARENLKHGWVPMLVRHENDMPEGNARLIKMGAIPFEPKAQRRAPRLLDYLHGLGEHPTVTNATRDLFSQAGDGPASSSSSMVTEPAPDDSETASGATDSAPVAGDIASSPRIGDLFPVVWPSLALALDEERTDREMAELFGEMQIGQMRTWLQRAVDEGRVEKRTRPVRYVLRERE